MLTKTQYKLLIQSYMDRYECSYISALQLMAQDSLKIYQDEHIWEFAPEDILGY
jgi:hypothetical protein